MSYRPFHLVRTYFHLPNDVAVKGKVEKQLWLEYRVKLFQRTTLRCLQNQTFHDFQMWYTCHENTPRNVIAPLLRDDLNSVATFGDHYARRAKPLVSEQVWTQLALSTHVYITRIDSDDLMCPAAMQMIHDEQPKYLSQIEALIFQRGYLHDIHTRRWGIYSKHSSPFHTLIVPTPIFLDSERFASEFVGDHSKIAAAYPWRKMPDDKICVLCHSNNIGSTFDSLKQGEFSKSEYGLKCPNTWEEFIGVPSSSV